MREGAGYNAMHITAENTSNIGDRLSLAQTHLIRRQVKAIAPQLMHCHLKTDPGAQRWFLEHESQYLTRQHLWCCPTFHFQRLSNDFFNLRSTQIGYGKQVFCLHL